MGDTMDLKEIGDILELINKQQELLKTIATNLHKRLIALESRITLLEERTANSKRGGEECL